MTAPFIFRSRRRLGRLCLAGLGLLTPSLAADARAQTPASPPAETAASTPIESRAQALAREQAEKTRTARPYEPTRAEKIIDLAEDLVLSPPDIYPWFGSIYQGGLFALGAGVRKPIGDTALFDIHGGYSFRGYTGVETRFALPEFAGGRLRVSLDGELINAPKVQFHGLGQDSAEANPTTYLYRPATVGGTVSYAPVKRVSLGGGVDYMSIETDAGRGPISIEERFTSDTAPGLGASPTYVRTRLFAGYDWRTSPGYTTRGGWYHVEWTDYRQQNDTIEGEFSFRRTNAEVQQYVPVLGGRSVVVFRGLVSTTDAGDGNEVPYFLTPDLGGNSELRGYSAFRFRDRHRLLLTGEYRWLAGQFVDMALFVDAGKVTAARRDLNFEDLVPTYGVGVRFHAPGATVLRIDVAKTREGVGIIVSAGQIF